MKGHLGVAMVALEALFEHFECFVFLGQERHKKERGLGWVCNCEPDSQC